MNVRAIKAPGRRERAATPRRWAPLRAWVRARRRRRVLRARVRARRRVRRRARRLRGGNRRGRARGREPAVRSARRAARSVRVRERDATMALRSPRAVDVGVVFARRAGRRRWRRSPATQWLDADRERQQRGQSAVRRRATARAHAARPRRGRPAFSAVARAPSPDVLAHGASRHHGRDRTGEARHPEAAAARRAGVERSENSASSSARPADRRAPALLASLLTSLGDASVRWRHTHVCWTPPCIRRCFRRASTHARWRA